MTQQIVVIGAGGFGREVLDVIDAINETSPTWQVVGVVDDAPAAVNLERLERREVRYAGIIDDLIAGEMRCAYVVGVGSPSVRRRLAERLDAAGFEAATLVHPTAARGFDVTVGAGSILCAGVRITTNVHIGRHVHINLNSTVGHDSLIGDFVSINPLASISGDCTLGDEVLIGVAGIVLNQVTVGHGSTVGGSACVVRDVPPGVVVKGVPAR